MSKITANGKKYTYTCCGCHEPILDTEPAMMSRAEFETNTVKGTYHKRCLPKKEGGH